jgi:hypothetical protein
MYAKHISLYSGYVLPSWDWWSLVGWHIVTDRHFLPSLIFTCKDSPRESHWREELSTIDLLVLTNLDQLLLMMQTWLSFFTKQVTLMRRSIVLSLPLSLCSLALQQLSPKMLGLPGRGRQWQTHQHSIGQ